MLYTLLFGARVRSADDNLGKLERIIVNNGIANQLSVDPGLLGYERVIPINIIDQTSDDEIQVTVGEGEWKSYPSFSVQRSVDTPSEEGPNLAALTPEIVAWAAPADTDHVTMETGARETDRTVDMTSVVLTSGTRVVLENQGGETHKLRGLIADTGRLQQLVLDNGTTISADAVTLLDEDRIHVGGQHQRPVLDADRGYEATEARDPQGDERR
jgi:hypothetical protein